MFIDSYKKAILKTLCYSAIFDYPLTKGELWKYLIWQEKKAPKLLLFFKQLNLLLKKKKIFQIKKYYLLKDNYSWVKKRVRSEKEARSKIKIAQRVSKILSIIPSVELIGLSGKLALGIAEKQDDIDLLIITQSGYLWLTRLLVILILSFLGIRRKPNDLNLKNKICVNMLIDCNHLNLPKNEKDLFSAHEISQLKPLFVRNNCYQEFLIKNQWVRKYLPNGIMNLSKRSWRLKIRQKCENFFEKIAQEIQLKYMEKKKTTEVIKKGYLRFHPQDARGQVFPKYYKIVKTINL